MIDNKTEITGSFNWSPATAHTNDESLLVMHASKPAAHFTREMNPMWRSAELRTTPQIQRKLDPQRAKYCGAMCRAMETWMQNEKSLLSKDSRQRSHKLDIMHEINIPLRNKIN